MSTTTETTLSVAGQFTQADIPALLQKVEAQIKALTKGKEEKTNITNPLEGIGEISKIEDVSNLIKAYSSVSGREEHYQKAAKECLPEGVSVPVFKLSGHSASEWKNFIKERILEVSHKKELEKLRKIKQKLEENLSQEAKLAKDLAEISQILTKED